MKELGYIQVEGSGTDGASGTVSRGVMRRPRQTFGTILDVIGSLTSERRNNGRNEPAAIARLMAIGLEAEAYDQDVLSDRRIAAGIFRNRLADDLPLDPTVSDLLPVRPQAAVPWVIGCRRPGTGPTAHEPAHRFGNCSSTQRLCESVVSLRRPRARAHSSHRRLLRCHRQRSRVSRKEDHPAFV